MADKGTTVAKAYVQVMPSMEGATSNITDAILPQIGGLGGEAGEAFSGMFKGKLGAVLAMLPQLLASLGVTKFISDSVEVGKAFDQSMSQVAATMGTTVGEIQNLRNFAQEMGASTAYSATEAADALNYMALAGYDAETSMSMLPTVLNLAAAGNIDLASASDMVTDAQSALGLSIDQTSTMVDQMAKTASTTNTSVAQLGDAFLTVGGTAKMMKGGTAELSQTLGLLADNGIKGSEGGTALRNILLSLSAPTDQAAEQMKALGLQVFDAEGNMRSMQDIMADFNVALDGMTSQERANVISTIFNKRDLKSVEALLGTTAERWDEVAVAIDNAQGSAQQMAETQLDNLAGDITLFESALEGLQIKVSDVVTPAIRAFYQFAASALSGITNFVSDNQAVFTGLANILGGVAEIAFNLVGGALNILGTALGTAFSALGPVIALLEGFVNILGGVLNFVGKLAAPVVEAFTNISAAAQESFGQVSAVISQDMADAQQAAGLAADGLVAWVNGDFETAKANASAAFEIIKTNISGKFEAAKNAVGGLADQIGQALGFPGLGDKVRGIFDGIRAFIEDPIGKAKEFIQGAIDKISGIITGANLQLPKIKLPHFNIAAGQVPWGIGGMGTPPRISIDWYAHGGIVNTPSLIGVGEAGSEAIVPLTAPNLAPFAEAVAERIERSGDTYIFNITADSETTLQRLVQEAKKARLLHA